MRVRDQVIGAIALAAATYFGLWRIAEAKCDAAVGSRGVRIDETHPEELLAFRALQVQLVGMGQGSLAARLEELRDRRELWSAPAMGADRWAAYVQSLGLVKRIYIRRVALVNPRAHLYPMGAPNVPEAFQNAFAWLSLGGAMRHELAHREGALDEASAYRIETLWYEEVRRAPFMNALDDDARRAWDWAIESALLSVRKAAQKAGHGQLRRSAPVSPQGFRTRAGGLGSSDSDWPDSLGSTGNYEDLPRRRPGVLGGPGPCLAPLT